MIDLDERSSLLLTRLLKSSAPVSALELSRRYNLTPRKVRYSIKKIELNLKKRGIKLDVKPGQGYQLIAPQDVKDTILLDIKRSPSTVVYSRENRQSYLKYSLLDSDCSINLKQFQLHLNTSRTTIIKDLDQIEEWFNSFDIKLVRKQNYGCFLQGDEVKKRKAIIACIIEMFGEIRLMEIIGGVKKVYSSNIQYKYGELPGVGNIFKDLDIQYFVNLVNLIQDITSERYTDKSYILIVLNLAVLVKRIRNKYRVEEFSSSLCEDIQSKQVSYAATIAENIRHSFNISIPEAEVNYIAFLLSKLNIRRSVSNELTNEKYIDFNAKQVFEVVGSILNYASLYLHPALKFDKELIQGLIQHIITFFIPSVPNHSRKNPILEEVRKAYPNIYDISQDSVKPLEEMIGRSLDEDEISFFTMHLAASMEKLKYSSPRKLHTVVICNAGIATSNLLVSRVRTEFPELDVVSTMTYLEYNQQKKVLDFDLVISSVPVESWEKPTIIVSPLLEPKDIKRLRKLVNKLTASTTIASGLTYASDCSLSSLIVEETIELQVSLLNWEQVIDHAGKILLDIGGIEPRYIYAMKRMMIAHGPYMVIKPGIALLHAFPDDGVKSLCMGLVTLKDPIEFGHKDFDPVSIVIALGAPGDESHLKAMSDLANLLVDTKAINVIRTTVQKANILKYVAKHSRQ